MNVVDTTPSPVRLRVEAGPGQPEPSRELEELYRGFERELLVPLWTEIGDLMPLSPQTKATAHLWRWDKLVALADQAGHLVPVGRGGERRAIALANPSLGGKPYATPTLWAAIQYLMPGEDAPEHRHTQNAFRFVVEGEGVWTVVNGDAIRMSRGDFLPQSAWNWHAHHNAAKAPMAWIDGLDIPFTGRRAGQRRPDEDAHAYRPEHRQPEAVHESPIGIAMPAVIQRGLCRHCSCATPVKAACTPRQNRAEGCAERAWPDRRSPGCR